MLTLYRIKLHTIFNPIKYFSTTNVQLYKIYTKTGDKGKSSTFTGDRFPKDHALFEALGTTDELTCSIGLSREYINDSLLNEQLERIQCTIQELQSTIATPKSKADKSLLQKVAFEPLNISQLETMIDEHTKALPPLTNFILPSGGKASCHLQLSRAICRRAERRVVPLVADEEVDLVVLQYLNRLSDYLFTVARVAAKLEGKEETIFKPSK